VRTFRNLPVPERGLLLRALPIIVAIRLALWLMPLGIVWRLLRTCEHLPISISTALPVSRLEWAVRAVSRRVPMASCLTQSLALQFLLVRAGRPSEIHIGVKKDMETGFHSHAWVECEGSVLLSGPSEVAMYSRLLAFGERD
jgi:hypothetical protein